MRVLLHAHTRWSYDGFLTPAELGAKAARRGFGAVLVSDHVDTLDADRYARLVEECIRFSREKGYRKLVLWTHAHLLAARAIYAAAGFRKLNKTEVHDTFGPRAVSEFWELRL